MKIASKSLFISSSDRRISSSSSTLSALAFATLFCCLLTLFSSSSSEGTATSSRIFVSAQFHGGGRGGGNGDQHHRHMPGRDENFRMPDRNMGHGSFESRARGAESAGEAYEPGGMNDNLGQDRGDEGVAPENEYDREEQRRGRDRDGMGGWAKTKRPGVKADTSFRERMKQFENNPFMSRTNSRSRHAEDAYPNDLTGGQESNLRRKKDAPRKRKSKVPAKPGHVNARRGSKHHYSRYSDDGGNPGSAKAQFCFKKALPKCSIRVMQENFAAYTKCIVDSRKEFGKECEDWAGAQAACLTDMRQKCAKQNPSRTTRCLKEKGDKGELSNVCRDSDFFKSLEQGFSKFDQNYQKAGGDDVFEHDPQEFDQARGGGFEGDDDDDSFSGTGGAGAGASGGKQEQEKFSEADQEKIKEEAKRNARSKTKDQKFSSDEMEKIKRSAMESVMKEDLKNPDFKMGEGAFPTGAGDFPSSEKFGFDDLDENSFDIPDQPNRIPRERQLGGGGSGSKRGGGMRPVDDL